MRVYLHTFNVQQLNCAASKIKYVLADLPHDLYTYPRGKKNYAKCQFSPLEVAQIFPVVAVVTHQAELHQDS